MDSTAGGKEKEAASRGGHVIGLHRRQWLSKLLPSFTPRLANFRAAVQPTTPCWTDNKDTTSPTNPKYNTYKAR